MPPSPSIVNVVGGFAGLDVLIGGGIYSLILYPTAGDHTFRFLYL